MNMLDGKVFNDKTSLALYLKDNFRKSMTFITDESLYAILQSLDESLYEQIINLIKIYEEFLVLNEGFVKSEYNTDIKIPEAVKTKDAETFKEKIDNVLATGDLSKLLEYLPTII